MSSCCPQEDLLGDHFTFGNASVFIWMRWQRLRSHITLSSYSATWIDLPASSIKRCFINWHRQHYPTKNLLKTTKSGNKSRLPFGSLLAGFSLHTVHLLSRTKINWISSPGDINVKLVNLIKSSVLNSVNRHWASSMARWKCCNVHLKNKESTPMTSPD